MRLVYKAEDGTEFSTEAECRYYEGANKLCNFIDNHFTGFAVIETYDVQIFIERHIDELLRIVKGDAATSDDGWISNEGNSSSHHPESLTRFDRIEVKLRNGTIQEGNPDLWPSGWKSTDNDKWDIVAYRIVK